MNGTLCEWIRSAEAYREFRQAFSGHFFRFFSFKKLSLYHTNCKEHGWSSISGLCFGGSLEFIILSMQILACAGGWRGRPLVLVVRLCIRENGSVDFMHLDNMHLRLIWNVLFRNMKLIRIIKCQKSGRCRISAIRQICCGSRLPAKIESRPGPRPCCNRRGGQVNRLPKLWKERLYGESRKGSIIGMSG